MTQERIGRNDSIFRDANEGIRAAAEEHGADFRVPFICECADPECRELVLLTVEEYRRVRQDPRWFVNALGHQVAAQGAADVIARYDGYLVVEKTGRAGEVAEELDGASGG